MKVVTKRNTDEAAEVGRTAHKRRMTAMMSTGRRSALGMWHLVWVPGMWCAVPFSISTEDSLNILAIMR